jgi:hypothetical protein
VTLVVQHLAKRPRAQRTAPRLVLPSATLLDQQGVAAVERAALVQLYQQLSGSQWTFADQWNTDQPHCQWPGVECLVEGNVSVVMRLTLQRFNIDGDVGQLLSTLAPLEYLSELFLQLNPLAGTLPEQPPVVLTRLADLDLFGTLVSGTLSSATAAALTRMRHLSLAHTQLSGVLPSGGAAHWTRMIELEVFGTQISGTLDPATLSHWTQLNFFVASSCVMSGTIPPEVGMWPLTHLDVFGTPFSGTIPREVANWTRTTYIDFSQTSVSGTLPEGVSAWNELREMYLIDALISGTRRPAGLWPVSR